MKSLKKRLKEMKDERSKYDRKYYRGYVDAINFSIGIRITQIEITDKIRMEELYDICDSVHASCDSECPVYAKNGGVVNPTSKYGCSCFKDGRAMLLFLKNN